MPQYYAGLRKNGFQGVTKGRRPQTNSDEDSEDADSRRVWTSDEDSEDAEAGTKLLDPFSLPVTAVPVESESLYDAALVSAFGGVFWCPVNAFSGIEEEEEEHYRVHPAVLAVFGLALTTMQVALIVFLRVSMDQKADFTATVRSNEANGQLLLAGEILLIVIVALSLFDRMFKTIRSLAFCCNYWAWKQIHFHAKCDGQRPGILWSGWIVWPFTFVPLLFKWAIMYKVLALSASIILNDTKVSDAIFDCLALEFIQIFDSVAMKFVQANFGIYVDPTFEFRYDPDIHGEICLRTARGGRVLEQVVALLMIFGFYTDQTLKILHALQTDVLPIARDFCSRWHWMHNRELSPMTIIPYILFRVDVKLISIIHDPAPDFDRKGDPNKYDPVTGTYGICTEKYQQMSFHDYMSVFHSETALRTFGAAVLVLFIGRFGGDALAYIFRQLQVRTVEKDLRKLKRYRMENLKTGIKDLSDDLREKFEACDTHLHEDDTSRLSAMLSMVEYQVSLEKSKTAEQDCLLRRLTPEHQHLHRFGHSADWEFLAHCLNPHSRNMLPRLINQTPV